MIKWIPVLLTYFASWSVSAQFQEIITSNRPSIAISAWTIGAKTFQLEDGIDFTNSRWTGFKTQNFSNELFARLGLSERFEANILLTNGTTATWVSGTRSTTGFQIWTLDLGGRVKILNGNKFKPDLLVQCAWRAFTQGGYDPGAKFFLATNNTFGQFYFSTTFGIEYPDFSNDPEFTYALCPEYYIRNNVCVYAEIFGNFADLKYPGFDVGVAIAPLNDLQIDLFGGYITGGAVKTVFAELGVSWRFDWRKKAP